MSPYNWNPVTEITAEWYVRDSYSLLHYIFDQFLYISVGTGAIN